MSFLYELTESLYILLAILQWWGVDGAEVC